MGDSFEVEAWKKFEQVVVKILEAHHFKITTHFPQGDKGYDLDAVFSGNRWAIEVKYYRSSRGQARLLEAAAARVATNGLESGANRGALVVSCYINPELRIALEKKFDIAFIDRVDLEIMAASDPDLVADLDAVLETPPEIATTDSTVGVGDRFTILTVAPTAQPVQYEGKKLADRLRGLPAGRNDATEYEKLCVDILKYLFGDHLVGWHEQNRTDDGLNRFDSICRVKPTHDFWRFVIEDLGSRYIVFEFKNYQDPITQGQVLTTEKYLFTGALRRVAFLITRKGGDTNSTIMTKGAMREHGKMILILDDAAIVDMLEKRDGGVDPTDLLFTRADEFMLTLAR